MIYDSAMVTGTGDPVEMRSGGEVQARIDAPAAAVYEVVSDVARTGEWSPECRRCAWVDGATEPVVGARFRGWNRWGFIRWSRLCEVVAATPGREFAFRTVPDRMKRDSTTWRFRLDAEGDHTLVTQSYEVEVLPGFFVNVVMRLFLRHHADMRPHMRQTLDRLKALVESSVAAGRS